MSHLIFSWNIDSTKPQKWSRLTKFIDENYPSIVCLNETKGKEENLAKLFESLVDYDYVINAHSPSQYHGVAVLIHKDIDWEKLDLKLECEARSDNRSKDPRTGRLIAIRCNNFFQGEQGQVQGQEQGQVQGQEQEQGDIIIVATYSPNSGIDYTNPLKNLTYRIESWDTALFKALKELENQYKNVIWIGDINVAPTIIDVSHPKKFERHAGFTQEERDSFNNFIQTSGWIDIWRFQHPNEIAYTFKGYRSSRYRLRLDNCVISPSLLDKVQESKIYPDKEWLESDHNPISIIL